MNPLTSSGQVTLTAMDKIINFLPNLLGGLLVVIIGYFMASIIRQVAKSVLKIINLPTITKKLKVSSEVKIEIWEKIIIELLGWAIFIIFLISALELWGLGRISEVLNQILFYLPQVISAVIIAFLGIIIANVISNIIKESLKSIKSSSAKKLAAMARYAVIFFTLLIVFDQLGIAQDLIRILFTGIVAMLAIAGGLAFGLGGKDTAKKIIEDFEKSLK